MKYKRKKSYEKIFTYFKDKEIVETKELAKTVLPWCVIYIYIYIYICKT